jgi:RsiW-degrading membrane proteinase PrsW (M82 family)
MSGLNRHRTRLEAQQIGRANLENAPLMPANHLRSSLWQADAASFALLILFVLFVTLVERLLQPTFSAGWLLIVGVLMALVPAFIWLTFFYRRDRLEPEPKLMVLQQFVLGGLLASAIGIPIVNNLFDVPDWLNTSPVWAQLLGGLLIVGFTQEFLKYAAVRFSVYNSPEFDEFTDGIVYMTAAGLGYATVLNIHFVVSSGGVDLANGAIRIVLTALAHASFAGITGYFLSREKFEGHSLWWMPFGIFIAASMNSVFSFFRGLITQGNITMSGSYVNVWGGLILALVLAAGVTWFLARTIARDLELLMEIEEQP